MLEVSSFAVFQNLISCQNDVHVWNILYLFTTPIVVLPEKLTGQLLTLITITRFAILRRISITTAITVQNFVKNALLYGVIALRYTANASLPFVLLPFLSNSLKNLPEK